MFLRSLVRLNNSISVRNFAPKSGWRQKKVFAAFWFYLSPEFRIPCCQVGITYQKNREEQTHFAPFSVRPERVPPLQNRRLCFSLHDTGTTNGIKTTNWQSIKTGIGSNQIVLIIVAGLRRSVYRVSGAHLGVTAPGQHSFFWRNVAAMASRWQHCVWFWPAKDLNLRLPTRDKRLNAQPTGRSRIGSTSSNSQPKNWNVGNQQRHHQKHCIWHLHSIKAWNKKLITHLNQKHVLVT